MKNILFLILFLPVSLFSQKAGDCAYVKYSNAGGYRDYSVVVQFSADSVLDYLAIKKEMRVSGTNIINHSFEVLHYMDSLGYSPISVCQDHKALDIDMLIMFKRK